MFVADPSGLVRRYGGSAWLPNPTPSLGVQGIPNIVDDGAGDFYLVNTGVIQRYTALTVAAGATGAPAAAVDVGKVGSQIYAMHRSGSGTDSFMTRLTGTVWASYGPTLTGLFSTVAGIDTTLIFAATNSSFAGIARYNSGTNQWTNSLTPVFEEQTFDRLECIGPSLCLATGRTVSPNITTTAKWNGTAWSESSQLGGTITDFQLLSPTLGYAVRNNMLGTHDGSVWTWEDIPVEGLFVSSISAVAPDDIFVGGTQGLLLHFDGVAWSRVRTTDTGTIIALHATPRVIVAVHDRGAPNYERVIARLVRTYDW